MQLKNSILDGSAFQPVKLRICGKPVDNVDFFALFSGLNQKVSLWWERARFGKLCVGFLAKKDLF